MSIAIPPPKPAVPHRVLIVQPGDGLVETDQRVGTDALGFGELAVGVLHDALATEAEVEPVGVEQTVDAANGGHAGEPLVGVRLELVGGRIGAGGGDHVTCPLFGDLLGRHALRWGRLLTTDRIGVDDHRFGHGDVATLGRVDLDGFGLGRLGDGAAHRAPLVGPGAVVVPRQLGVFVHPQGGSGSVVGSDPPEVPVVAANRLAGHTECSRQGGDPLGGHDGAGREHVADVVGGQCRHTVADDVLSDVERHRHVGHARIGGDFGGRRVVTTAATARDLDRSGRDQAVVGDRRQ